MNQITIEPPVFRAAVERQHGLTKPQVTRARELAAQGHDYDDACRMAAAKFDVRTYRESENSLSTSCFTWMEIVIMRPELRFLIPNDGTLHFSLRLQVGDSVTEICSVPAKFQQMATESDTDLGPDSYR